MLFWIVDRVLIWLYYDITEYYIRPLWQIKSGRLTFRSGDQLLGVSPPSATI